jgi:hypothetical protein
MNTKLIFIGQVYAVAKKQFEEQENIYAQFLNKQENGGIEIQQVKMTDIADIQNLKEGQSVKIPVKVSSFQNRLYFTQIEPIVK